LNYALTLTPFAIYLATGCPNVYFLGELLFILVAVLIRSFTIAVKYATFEVDRLKLIRSVVQPKGRMI